MSNKELEEYKRELVEAKLNRYNSSNKEYQRESRLTIKKAPTQPSQEDRHPSPLKSQEARRHK